MPAGKLRDRISFEAETETPDGGGGFEITWAEQFATRGQIMPGSVRERLEAGRLEAANRSMLRIRHSTDAAGIKASWRVIVNGDTANPYQIRSLPEDPTRKRRWLDMEIEKGVAT